MLGVTNAGFGIGANVNIPNTNGPNAIFPFWDDLNPATGGSVWLGFTGLAPNRKAVVSWVAVPHNSLGGGPFTFQAILHESGHVTFQYVEVSLGSTSFTNGRSATVGIEDPSGLFGTKYRDFSLPGVTLTNHQALVFTPQFLTHPAPGLAAQRGATPSETRLTLSGEPAQPCALLFSTNLASWTMVQSNILPASGLSLTLQTNAAPQRFYRGVSGPFLP